MDLNLEFYSLSIVNTEFEDLEFLKEYGIDINKLMNEDYE